MERVPVLTSRLVLLTLCVLKVVSPEGADLVLPTYIPHSEADVLVLHCFHVKPLKKDNSGAIQHVKQTYRT